MKIEKFSKAKNGMYLLSLDDGCKVKIHEDLILKYELLLSKCVTTSLLEKIEKENEFYDVYNIALKYINNKLRSRKELKNYLGKKDVCLEVVEKVIEMLADQGYLDDNLYAAAFVHDKILMSNYGPNKIKQELESLGINSDVINDKINSFTEEIEKEKIEKIVNKLIKQNHNKSSIVLKKKIYSYLLNLGYSSDLINESLNGKKLVDENIYKKEYEKLYNKLSKRFSGKELEYKLKQKMYQKGFIE